MMENFDEFWKYLMPAARNLFPLTEGGEEDDLALKKALGIPKSIIGDASFKFSLELIELLKKLAGPHGPVILKAWQARQ